ncbi:hypothetical protein WJX84_006783 [Apatococcus fuscideae]|uniref:Uncharacterized protein n=1 Tax=Apatococcus fuscideae TaxID=2026836 RepID=A0AAW1TGA4_9CHLO
MTLSSSSYGTRRPSPLPAAMLLPLHCESLAPQCSCATRRTCLSPTPQMLALDRGSLEPRSRACHRSPTRHQAKQHHRRHLGESLFLQFNPL